MGLAVGLAAMTLFVPTTSAQSLSDKGLALSREHCARCHVIEAANRFSGIASTPSFPMLVRALKDWRERFETFHARLPHPSVIRIDGIAPPSNAPATTRLVYLKPEDIDAFVAYAETLRPQ
ncbi:MAG: hypothetical protein AAGL24_25160 [Pseudomonadota bacterium]